MNWPYHLSSNETSDVYVFNQTTDLSKDLLAKQHHLLELAKINFTGYDHHVYHINTEDFNEALRVYASLIPQLSVKVNTHSKTEMDVVLGFHAMDYEGNVVSYG